MSCGFFMGKHTMPNNDEGHKLTERELNALEKRIADVYGQAVKELDGVIKDYFEKLKQRDEEMRKLIGTELNGKTWTERDYTQWRINQLRRGKRFEVLRDKLAERMTKANETAVAYVNDATQTIYSINRNYTAYTIEQSNPSADFTLWDERTVKRLIVEAPDLMPHYPLWKAVKRGIDLDYGRKQITASVTSGILQGKGIDNIARDLLQRISDMSLTSAIRTARTAVTEAQNAGRQDTYEAAADMGIKVRKMWLATLDGRTRHEHGMLDGQKVEQDKPFEYGGMKLMFPADSTLGAPASMIYNCRCTMVYVDELDELLDQGMRRAIDPETGESVLVPWKTFQEWAGQKKLVNDDKDVIISLYRKKIGNDRQNVKPISDKRFDELTIQAKKNGANIIVAGYGSEEYKYLEARGATAACVDDTLIFRPDRTITEVLEETFHFEQNINKLNIDKEAEHRRILNEIEAQRYLIDNADKYAIPRAERIETEKLLKIYLEELAQMEGK